MYKSSTPQDAFTYYSGATTFSGTGAVTWASSGLAYIDTLGMTTVSMQIVGAYTATIQPQWSDDLVTWLSVGLQNDASVPLAENTSIANTAGMFSFQVKARYFRINISVYTSSPTLYVYGKPGNTAPATQPAIAILEAGSAVIGTVNTSSPYPTGATAVTASSGNVANANAVATLPNVSAKTTYITGFEITSSGATAGAVVTATVVGTISGTMSYTFTAPTGALLNSTPLIVAFPIPIPGSATNTAIVVTLPALGAGNTNATVSAHGYNI